MTAREALRLGTRGGAPLLGRDDIGSLEPGKCADFAVWRTDGLELGGASDPVAGLVFAAPHRVDRLVVGGRGRRPRRCARTTPTRTRSRAPIGSRREDSHRERLDLHPRPRHGSGRARAGRLRGARSRDGLPATSGETDADGRISPLAEGLEPGDVLARLPPAVGVLHPRRARGRARRGPLPRAAPRLALRMRELPRKLTVEELAELFEGRTRLVERLAEIDDPLERADDVLAELDEAGEARGAGGTSRRSGSDRSLGAVGRRAGRRRRPVRARRARLAERRVREEVRVPVRRLRERPPEGARSSTSSDSGSGGRARRSSTRAATSSSRSRGIDGPVPERRPRRLHPDAPRRGGDRLDRRVVLLRPPRPRAAPAEEGRGRRGGRRRRVLGRPRRRPLPLAEVPPRASRDARAAPLVQVGGVHDLALGVRARSSSSTTSTPTSAWSTRGRPTSRPGRRSRSSVLGIVLAWVVYDVLCRAARGAERDGARRRRDGARRARGLGRGTALLRTRRVPPGRRDARDDHGRERLLRDHPGAPEARRRDGGGPRARRVPAAGRRRRGRCTTTTSRCPCSSRCSPATSRSRTAPTTRGSSSSPSIVLTALVRVFFNRWHAGRRAWWVPAVATVGVVALAVLAPARGHERRSYGRAGDLRARSQSVIAQRCATVPLGRRRRRWESGSRPRRRSRRASTTSSAWPCRREAMPPGNATGMTDEERSLLAAWVAQNG